METTSRVWAPAMVAAAAIVLVVVLIPVVGQRGGPPVVRLAAGDGDVSVAPVGPSPDEMAPGAGGVVEFRFVLTEQAHFGAGRATAWRFEPPAALEVAAARLAAQLGMTGDPVTAPDGSISIGPDDGTGPTLSVGTTGDWWLDTPPCDLDDDETEPETCTPVPASAGVPDQAKAEAAAAAFFADVNPAIAPRVTETLVDEHVTLVVASLLVAGQDTDIFVSIAFGPDAAVVDAHGTLARPTEVAGYPTIDAAAAAARLEDHFAGQDWGKVLADPESDETEVRTVTLAAVAPRLVTIVDADGVHWLLPGVRFTDTDGRSWDVLTVADDYLVVGDRVTPEPSPMPADVEREPSASLRQPSASASTSRHDGVRSLTSFQWPGRGPGQRTEQRPWGGGGSDTGRDGRHES